MKFLETYTVRGRVEHLTETRINLFDGKYDTGFRLVSFEIAPYNFVSGDTSTSLGRLATENGLPLVRESFWDFNDTRQIGWAAINGENFEIYPEGSQSIVDRSKLIIEDMYITCLNRGDVSTNYIAVFEKFKLEPFQGSLAIVQNRSQG
jgi:hypothetical protein